MIQRPSGDQAGKASMRPFLGASSRDLPVATSTTTRPRTLVYTMLRPSGAHE